MFVCCTESVSVQTVVSDHSVGVCLFVCCTESVSVQTVVSDHSVYVCLLH